MPPTSIMTNKPHTVECENFGELIDESVDTANYRYPCNKYGYDSRIIKVSIEETVIARDGLELKARRPGDKRPYIEDKGVPSHSHRLNKIVHHQRLIDRDNDLYRETVTDYESGEIIHRCEEPLSKHRGHGSDKHKLKP